MLVRGTLKGFRVKYLVIEPDLCESGIIDIASFDTVISRDLLIHAGRSVPGCLYVRTHLGFVNGVRSFSTFASTGSMNMI